jgi:DNA replicative helicase MCM subunit Mcm2 (Cdc46/Mcm family)
MTTTEHQSNQTTKGTPMNATTKTDTQLKQTAMQLLTLQDISDSLQDGSMERHALIVTIAQVFSTQVPGDQYGEFIGYYNDYKQAKADHRREIEAAQS